MAAQLHITRKSGGWADRARRYIVVLDGGDVGRIRHGESITLETDAGHHTLHLKIAGSASKPSPAMLPPTARGAVVDLRLAGL